MMRRSDAPGGSGGSGRRPLYYLSLGDSLSIGVQPIGREEEQYRTDEGYPDQLHAAVRRRVPDLQLVKLGCPGESTVTMREGGLAPYPRGSQLAEAVAFLSEHRGSVAFVTIDVGGNDFPGYTLEAVPVGLASIDRNLPVILEALRRAAGPEPPIVGMNLYDPFLAAWLQGPEGVELARVSVWEGVVPVNAHIAEICRAAGCSVADVEGAFSTTDFETLVSLDGAGEVPINVARAAGWTWFGAQPPLGPDPHCNALGYAAIAGAFERAIFGDDPMPGPLGDVAS
jgi:lysophospholipase L1-like esterase